MPWITALVEYVKRALGDARVRIVGLCFGHQIVGRALGAEGGPNKLGYEMSVRRVALTPVGKEIFGKEDLVCATTSSCFLIAADVHEENGNDIAKQRQC